MGSTDEIVTPGSAITASRPGVWLTEASLVLMALIWGVNYSVVKFGTTLVDPLAYNGLRVMLAALVLVGIARAMRLPLPPRRTTLGLLALGVLGNCVYQAMFVEGLARTRASDAALVVAASPAFIAIIGRLRGIERISQRGVAGIALSMLGMVLVVIGSTDAADGHATLVGDMIILVGSVCWAAYTVWLKPYTDRVSSVQISMLTMVGGAIPLFCLALPSIARIHWSAMPTLGWLAILYSGIPSLVIAYFFWYRGVRVIGPTRSAMFSNLQPIIAVLFAWMMLGERPTPWQLVGMGGIMGGLLLTRR